MEPVEYEKMAALEDHLWWYQGLHARLLDAVDRFAPRPLKRLLDDGCGTGGFLRKAEQHWPDAELDGVDRAGVALELARARTTRARVAPGDAGSLPYGDGIFDAIVLADVLCHRAVEPGHALREGRRCLRPGGVIIVNVPAYEWMMSAHDASVHTARRFTLPGLRAEVERAGLDVIHATHWNAMLFPLMVAHRWFSRSRSGSDVRPFPPAVDRLFRWALTLERRLTRSVDAPFGGSVLVVGMRRE